MMSQEAVRLNIGCGLRTLPGFHNIDNSPSVFLARHPLLKDVLYRLRLISEQHYKTRWPTSIVRRDASKRLPYPPGSVDRIYSSHFLEHLPYAKAIDVLRECRRLLKPGGVFRLVVPDLLIHAKQYVAASEEVLVSGSLSREPHDRFLKTVCGGYLGKLRSAHYYMYDWPTLSSLLTEIGFEGIRRCEFGQSNHPELAAADNRPDDSLIVEMTVAADS